MEHHGDEGSNLAKISSLQESKDGVNFSKGKFSSKKPESSSPWYKNTKIQSIKNSFDDIPAQNFDDSSKE